MTLLKIQRGIPVISYFLLSGNVDHEYTMKAIVSAYVNHTLRALKEIVMVSSLLKIAMVTRHPKVSNVCNHLVHSA
jgi:hypothetical protein